MKDGYYKVVNGTWTQLEQALAGEGERLSGDHYNWRIKCPKCGNEGRMDTFAYEHAPQPSAPPAGEQKWFPQRKGGV